MVSIREYRPSDEGALYDVCLRTGDDGADATGSYSVPTLLGEVFVGPYLEFEPAWARVVDVDGVASGYLLCAPDTTAFEKRCESDWWPRLRSRYPVGTFPVGTPDSEVVGLIHRPPVAPADVVAEYPAHLHIDLLPAAQGSGLGGELIRDLMRRLADAGVSGVHLGVSTANTRAIGFYEHLGFTSLSSDEGGMTMGARLNAPTLR